MTAISSSRLQRFRSLQVSCSSIFSHQGSFNSVAVRKILRSFFDLTHDSARLASSKSIASLAGPQSRSGAQRWLRISLRTVALCRSMESSSRLPCSSHSLVTISSSILASVLSLSLLAESRVPSRSSHLFLISLFTSFHSHRVPGVTPTLHLFFICCRFWIQTSSSSSSVHHFTVLLHVSSPSGGTSHLVNLYRLQVVLDPLCSPSSLNLPSPFFTFCSASSSAASSFSSHAELLSSLLELLNLSIHVHVFLFLCPW